MMGHSPLLERASSWYVWLGDESDVVEASSAEAAARKFVKRLDQENKAFNTSEKSVVYAGKIDPKMFGPGDSPRRSIRFEFEVFREIRLVGASE